MPDPRIRISGGRLIDPGNRIDGLLDICIAEGRIVAIGRSVDGFSADIELDASGLYVIPGLIDLNARLREPGEEFKATIDSECSCGGNHHPVLSTGYRPGNRHSGGNRTHPAPCTAGRRCTRCLARCPDARTGR